MQQAHIMFEYEVIGVDQSIKFVWTTLFNKPALLGPGVKEVRIKRQTV